MYPLPSSLRELISLLLFHPNVLQNCWIYANLIDADGISVSFKHIFIIL